MSKKWFTNGIKEIQVDINRDYILPEGFYLGRKPKTKEQEQLRLKKFKNTMMGKTSEEKEKSNKERSNSLKNTFAKKTKDEMDLIITKRKKTMDSKTEQEKLEYREKISISTKGKNTGKIPWNKGLTKETDPRLENVSERTRKINLLKAKELKIKNPNYYQNWREKISETMRLNKSFNTSRPEEEYYEELCKEYGSENVKRQYYDVERYPYNCDFYISSEDLFIELNLCWTHGGRSYNPTDIECQKQLNEWKEKAKTSQFYKNAIYTWTDLDVRKQNCAKENNLNYIIIY